MWVKSELGLEGRLGGELVDVGELLEVVGGEGGSKGLVGPKGIAASCGVAGGV